VQYLLLGGTVSLVTCRDLGSMSRALGERWKDKTTHNCNEIGELLSGLTSECTLHVCACCLSLLVPCLQLATPRLARHWTAWPPHTSIAPYDRIKSLRKERKKDYIHPAQRADEATMLRR
jgi:hypothetical protein